MAITPLPIPPSRSDPANFSTRADDFLGQLPTFTSEANSLAADVNSKQSTASSAASTATLKAAEAVSSAINASTSATNANSYQGMASTYRTEAQNWAIKTDGPVSGSEYSAKYWGQIAQGFVVGTLLDDSTTSTAKTWTSSKIYSWGVPKVGGASLSGGQITLNHSGGNPSNSSSYGLKINNFGSGIVFHDVNLISIYPDSTGTDLKIGFGPDGSITNKFTFNNYGDFTSSGQVTCTQLNCTSTADIAKVSVNKSGYNDAIFYTNSDGWGLYSTSGGALIQHLRSTGKNYFSGIASDALWSNDNVSFVPGTGSYTSGRTRYPNGHIRQWGTVTVDANSTASVSFGLAFPNFCSGATLTILSNSTTSTSGFASIAAVGTNNLVVNNRYGMQLIFYWEANGY